MADEKGVVQIEVENPGRVGVLPKVVYQQLEQGGFATASDTLQHLDVAQLQVSQQAIEYFSRIEASVGCFPVFVLRQEDIVHIVI